MSLIFLKQIKVVNFIDFYYQDQSLLYFFHLLAPKPNLENVSIDSNKFFHNFHLSESSFTCHGFWASGLPWRLQEEVHVLTFVCMFLKLFYTEFAWYDQKTILVFLLEIF